MEKTIRRKKNHFPPFDISSESKSSLTVFDRIEERAARIERRKEEEATVDRDSRGDEGDDFKLVELTREVGLAG